MINISMIWIISRWYDFDDCDESLTDFAYTVNVNDDDATSTMMKADSLTGDHDNIFQLKTLAEQPS